MLYFLNDVLIHKHKIPFDRNWEVGFDRTTSIYGEYEQFYHIRNKMIGEFKKFIFVRDLVATDLSASFIRDSIKKDIDISTFIDKEVYYYIKENNLYK